jgi:hypothetical protein
MSKKRQWSNGIKLNDLITYFSKFITHECKIMWCERGIK